MRAQRRVAFALLGTVVLAGCGGGATSSTTTAVETVDKPAKLPAAWTTHINRAGGYTIGAPPGWVVDDHGARTELRSPEQLAAVSVTIDRTNEVLDVPLDQLASATISAGVPGLRDVKPGEPSNFPGHYDGAILDATGVGGDQNVRERLQLAIVRRPGIATFTVLAAENAMQHPHFYDDEIKRMIRSLRSRPINPP